MIFENETRLTANDFDSVSALDGYDMFDNDRADVKKSSMLLPARTETVAPKFTCVE